jgi:hypothetical protein
VLKLVLIGVALLGVVAFVMWNFWRMILVKRKYYKKSGCCFDTLQQFEDAPARLKTVQKAKTVLWAMAVLVSVLALAGSMAYFLIARAVFAEHHDHVYRNRVIAEPTCITEGTLQYTCRYCDDGYTEPIPTVDHRYTETNRTEPTCIQEGVIERTCDMCKDVQIQAIEPVEHKYTEKIEKEATCTCEGVLVRQCENCDAAEQESIPVNDEHIFELASFTSANFMKKGYHHFTCRDCGAEEYSPRVQGFNWLVVLTIVVLLIGLVIMIGSGGDSWGAFLLSLLFIFASVAMLVVHCGVVLSSQKKGEIVFPQWSGAPVECQLVETERVESTYTANGTVKYQCAECKSEYTEILALKKVDPENISIYQEPTVEEKKESKKNGSLKNAMELPMFTRVTGNLSSTDDVDCYKVTMAADGKLLFRFTHEGNEYSYHWDATIYDTDQTTVLNEGYIDKDEFGTAELPAGTYYLKISAISGGNPILNQYSDADYHLQFAPVCTNHGETAQYFSEVPSCTQSVEIKTVCKHCGAVVAVEPLGALEHRWSEWEIIMNHSSKFSGKKIRVCAGCNLKEEKNYFRLFD